jgi:hypothetical protein
MTFSTRLNKVNLLLVLALLVALLVPVMGFAAGQSIAYNELFESGSTENVHSTLDQGLAIACVCGDPGGSGPNGCC